MKGYPLNLQTALTAKDRKWSRCPDFRCLGPAMGPNGVSWGSLALVIHDFMRIPAASVSNG